MEKKIYIDINKACGARLMDASLIKEYFRLNNCTIVNNPANADFLIFVSCAFRERRLEECFKIIDRLSKYKGELIVVGCLPEIAPQRFREKFQGRFLSTRNLSEIDIFFGDFKVKFSEIPDTNYLFNNEPPLLSKFLKEFEFSKAFFKRCLSDVEVRLLSFTRGIFFNTAFLRICWGCIENCSYCSFLKPIGRLKSKPAAVCLKEYKGLLDKGYRNFLITGDNPGIYGLDIDSSLPELLKQLSTIDKDFAVTWRMYGLGPRWIAKYESELFEIIKEKKIVSLICPLQSGSERVLGLMKRYFSIEETARILLRFKEANSDLILTTHLIVGFPSETEEDFLASLNIAKRVRFNLVVLYPYYDAENTLSHNIENKIDEKTKMERIRLAIEFLNKEGIYGMAEFYSAA